MYDVNFEAILKTVPTALFENALIHLNATFDGTSSRPPASRRSLPASTELWALFLSQIIKRPIQRRETRASNTFNDAVDWEDVPKTEF